MRKVTAVAGWLSLFLRPAEDAPSLLRKLGSVLHVGPGTMSGYVGSLPAATSKSGLPGALARGATVLLAPPGVVYG